MNTVRIQEQNGAALPINHREEGSSKHTPRAATAQTILLLLAKHHRQGLRSHQACDPLVDPRSCDLTADVDFSTLKHVVNANGKLFNILSASYIVS